jgi:hypothetical protein
MRFIDFLNESNNLNVYDILNKKLAKDFLSAIGKRHLNVNSMKITDKTNANKHFNIFSNKYLDNIPCYLAYKEQSEFEFKGNTEISEEECYIFFRDVNEDSQRDDICYVEVLDLINNKVITDTESNSSYVKQLWDLVKVPSYEFKLYEIEATSTDALRAKRYGNKKTPMTNVQRYKMGLE